MGKGSEVMEDMTYYDYGEDGDEKRYRELYNLCCFYCKEALVKRLGTGKLKRKEYKGGIRNSFE